MIHLCLGNFFIRVQIKVAKQRHIIQILVCVFLIFGKINIWSFSYAVT
jgi:hypothetical protein